MPRQLTQLRIDEVSLVPRGADQDADIVLAKAASAEEELNMAELPSEVAKALDGTDLTDDQRAQLAILFESAREEVPEGFTEMVEESEEEAGAEAAVTEPEAVAKSAEVIDLEKRVLEGEERMAKMQRDADIAKAEDEAEDRYSELAKARQLGTALYNVRMNTATEEDIAVLDEVLAGASAQIKTSNVISTIGKSDEGSNSADAQMVSLTKRAKDANPSLSDAQAYREALNSDEGQAIWAEANAAQI